MTGNARKESMSSPPDWREVRDAFMLARDEIYLNAGTFSALPRPVYDELIRILAEAEGNPTRLAAWNGRLPLWRAQQQIAAYLGADPDDIIFHSNVTQALNQALFGFDWETGGEFLASDQEYGAIVNAAREMVRRRGLVFREFPLPLQPAGPAELCNAVVAALSPRTVGVLLSHVTTGTGLVLPVTEIGARLRERGVRLIVDGAHGPGLLPLDLGASPIDCYGGNLHKWFIGPKGTAFLYVARHLQPQMQPTQVGWGGVPGDTGPFVNDHGGTAHRFQYIFKPPGLRDFAPFLALPATLEFRRRLGEAALQQRIAALVAYTRERLTGLGLRCMSPPPPLQAGLIAFEPPPAWRDEDAAERLYRQSRITVAIFQVPPIGMVLRVSPHIWNDEGDIDRLVEALLQ